MIKFEHEHYVIYFGKCPEQNCTHNYFLEFAKRISNRIIDHGGREKTSRLLGMLQLMTIVMPVMMTLKSLELASETTRLKENLLKLS